MQTHTAKKSTNGHATTMSALPVPLGTKDPVDKLISQGLRTLREAKTTWKNNPGADIRQIVEGQLRLVARNLGLAADEIGRQSKRGGGR